MYTVYSTADCWSHVVTITSVTNMLSFFIGVITPFPCVKIFCLYTGSIYCRSSLLLIELP
jgi:hypothetical protein